MKNLFKIAINALRAKAHTDAAHSQGDGLFEKEETLEWHAAAALTSWVSRVGVFFGRAPFRMNVSPPKICIVNADEDIVAVFPHEDDAIERATTICQILNLAANVRLR